MKPAKHRFIFTTLMAIALCAGSSIASADSNDESLTDARQEVQIWTTYALSPYLRASDIKVTVHNGNARLNGTVEEDVSRDLAKEIALGVSGITSVDNQIKVQDDYVSPMKSSTRSYGEVIDDATITAAVKSKLLWSKHTDGFALTVTTQSGKVKLEGTVDKPAAKELAGRLAINTRGVIAVDNQLLVNEKVIAKKTESKAGREISDSWITTKIKSTYIYSSNVDSSDISVNTERGIVTLKGNLHSGAERALAIEMAENIRGVKGVEAKSLTF